MAKKFFNFDKAVKLMLKGVKIKHKCWKKSDYIFIENGKIFCDGGFEYSNYINNRLLISNNWQVSNLVDIKNLNHKI